MDVEGDGTCVLQENTAVCRKDDGSSCVLDSDCINGNCVDFVCCGQKCGGPTVSPEDGALIEVSDTITVTFNESMKVDSQSFTGDLAAEIGDVQWATTSVNNDTLIIPPNAAWSIGAGRTLIVTVQDSAGNALRPLILSYDVVAGAYYYVNGAVVDDNGDGLSPNTAKKTIQAAITAAGSAGTVLVATGTYLVTSGEDHVTLAEGVSLYGGYSSDFSANDPQTYPTIIQDQKTGGGNYLQPNRAVEAGAGITTATAIVGFTILAGSGSASGDTNTAVFVHEGGAPTIRNNVIKGGTGERTNGISTYVASPLIHNNLIHSGEGTKWAFGVYVLGESSSPIVSSPILYNNLITGAGTGTLSYGIATSNATTLIRNNIISGGTDGMYSKGISIYDDSSSVQIENNIIFTAGGNTRLCIGEGNDTAPATLLNNTLFGCPDALYVDVVGGVGGNCSFNVSSSCYKDIADVNDASVTTQGAPETSTGNISTDPLFKDPDGPDDDFATVEDNDWRFSTDGTSPCAVTRGGLDGMAQAPLWDFDDDVEGTIRTAPWSMGAFEYNGACATH